MIIGATPHLFELVQESNIKGDSHVRLGLVADALAASPCLFPANCTVRGGARTVAMGGQSTLSAGARELKSAPRPTAKRNKRGR